MTAFAKLVLTGAQEAAAAAFNQAARAYRDTALEPQVSLLDDGRFQVSLGGVIGAIEKGKVVEGQTTLSTTAPSLTEAFAGLARDFAGLADGACLVTTAPTQEYDTHQRLYRLEDGKVKQAAAYIAGARYS